MKLLLDLNISPAWIPFLKQVGYEAMHWSSIGPLTAQEIEKGALIVIDVRKSRLRLLPLRRIKGS